MTPQRLAEMERHLAHSPEDAARLERWRRRDMALRIGLPELAKAGERDLALQLRRRRDELHRHRNRRPMLRWAHAAAAAYLAGTATMVPAGTAADRDQLTENIATHLGVHVAPPDLSKFGFS